MDELLDVLAAKGRKFYEPAAEVSRARCVGMALAAAMTPDEVLEACHTALQEWNIHDLAAECLARIEQVPDWLRRKG